MKLLFLGDLFFDFDYCPDDIKLIGKYIRENDYKVIVNLESPIGNIGHPIKKRGPNLSSKINVIEVLKSLNVIAVCLANNHMMDYGEEALQFTIKLLEKAGIYHVGAGKNISEAMQPICLYVDGKRIFIQNFGWDVEETVYATKKRPGCAPLIRDKIIEKTRKIKSNNPGAIVINTFHWGFEYNTLPMPLDIDFAHKCIDNGCDLIIGHHPHVIQPIEKYKSKSICYSLGNFYFSSQRKEFIKEFMNCSKKNMCDYGIGILFDIEKQILKDTIIFRYDSKDNYTYFEHEKSILVDGKLMVDWKKDSYLDLIRKQSENYNPILTLNPKENAAKIRKLYFKYWVAARIRFIKKYKMGEVFFDKMKERMSNQK